MPTPDQVAIQSILSAAQRKPAPFEYQQAQVFAVTSDDILKQLHTVRRQLADSKGVLVQIGEQAVRVFNADEDFQVRTQDLYAKTLHHAEALLTIAQYENTNVDETFLRQCLLKYTADMQKITGNTAEDFAKAKEHSLECMGMLAEHLAEQRLQAAGQPFSEAEQNNAYLRAFQDMKKAVELLNMVSPSETAVCSVQKTDRGYEIQYSEKLKLPAPTTQAVAAEQQKAWYHQGVKKYGTWYQGFVDQHLPALMCTSPACTTRDMPNPANGWDEYSLFTDPNGRVNQEIHKIRSAISSPFNIKDTKARVEMAAQSMERMFTQERIASLAEDYIARWGCLLDDNESIDLPLLHQTLVAPTIFYGPDRNMMEVKHQSNQQVKAHLEAMDLEVQGHKIKPHLGQVNNCINMWHPIVIPTDNDIDDSNQMITHAAHLIAKLQNKVDSGDSQTKADIALAQAFLQDQRRSWLPFGVSNHRKPSPEQQKAIERLSQKLFRGEVKLQSPLTMSKQSQQDMSLMLQAAVNLKKLNHETQLGWGLRKFKNLIRIKEVPILAPITAVTLLPYYTARYVGNTARRLYTHFTDNAPPSLQHAFFPTRNNQTAKSAYEAILGSMLGITVGGCKSAYDREGEVAVHRQAMVSAFQQSPNGQLLDASSDDKTYYRYIQDHVERVERGGHVNRIAAHEDSIGARKMWETYTHQWSTASPEQKKIIKGNAAKFRKVKKPPTGKAKMQMLSNYTASVLNQFSLNPTPADVSKIAPITSSNPKKKQGNFSRRYTETVPLFSAAVAHQQHFHPDQAQYTKPNAERTPIVAQTVTYESVKNYVLRDDVQQKYQMKAVETELENQKAVELSFQRDSQTVTGYCINAEQDGVGFALAPSLNDKEFTFGLEKICRIAVDLAQPGDEFDLQKTPAEKRDLVAQYLADALEQAKLEGKFPEDQCPVIVGHADKPKMRPLFE